MDPVNMILFKKKQIPHILRFLKVDTDKKGRLLEANGETVICHTCGEEIEKKNLGNIMPGSRLFFCDNPLCFAAYLSEKKVTSE